jgi:hypothetical protein
MQVIIKKSSQIGVVILPAKTSRMPNARRKSSFYLSELDAPCFFAFFCVLVFRLLSQPAEYFTQRGLPPWIG